MWAVQNTRNYWIRNILEFTLQWWDMCKFDKLITESNDITREDEILQYENYYLYARVVTYVININVSPSPFVWQCRTHWPCEHHRL